MSEKLIIGCIADDSTGASDAASFLVKGGLRTILFHEIPNLEDMKGCEAVVIALKIRSCPAEEAVEKACQALSVILAAGANHIYYKYCSTFDSTRKGNIGPVVDALMERLNVHYTLLCPSLPVNGRTVHEGRIFVDGVPLEKSPLAHHPLNPMWDSRISVLMSEQGKYPCVLCTLGPDEKDESFREKVEKAVRSMDHAYVIPDYSSDQDGMAIAKAFSDLRLITGGSGLLEHLAREYSKGRCGIFSYHGVLGKALILSGSCSDMTLRQIEDWKGRGGECIKMDVESLLSGKVSAKDYFDEVQKVCSDVLVYSSDSSINVVKTQEYGINRVSSILEHTTGEIAKLAVDAGYKKIIVAGGETSGAVTRALGFDSYIVGPSVAPGVPVLIPLKNISLRIVLKSGNFGKERFFTDAIDITGEKNG